MISLLIQQPYITAIMNREAVNQSTAGVIKAYYFDISALTLQAHHQLIQSIYRTNIPKMRLADVDLDTIERLLVSKLFKNWVDEAKNTCPCT